MAIPFSMKPHNALKPLGNRAKHAFNSVVLLSALTILVLVLAILLTLVVRSSPSLNAFGLSFLYGRTWNPVSGNFGALPFLVGTLLNSFIALLISLPFSIAIAIFIGEYFRKGLISSFLQNVTELMAGIPSIIYGFWALFVLVPVGRIVQLKIGVFPYGVGTLTASLILSVMIIPYTASIGREVIVLVPSDLEEAAYALGATWQEVITKVILPHTRSGMFAGIILALGGALGETMAVTMVIGNSNILPRNLFSPGNTMASLIANEFAEATGRIYVSSLIEVALLLLLVSLVINIMGRYMIKKMSQGRIR